MIHDLKYSFLNQLAKLVSGPLILLIIPLYLSATTQGLWFSIISLGALVVLVDLGFSTIVTQFAAHEFAHLHLTQVGLLEGPVNHMHRLSSLFHFCIKQIKFVGIFIFPILLIINFLILSYSTDFHEWLIPWFLYNIASFMLFTNNIILSFIEGCNQVAISQKIRLQIAIVNIMIMIILLFFHVQLYALALGAFVSASLGLLLIYMRFGFFIRNFDKNGNHYPWHAEIYPLLKRYAGSFMSGYFMFQIFTPVALTYYGPIEAGKVGLSIAIWTALLGISNVWLTVVTPKINMLVARKEYDVLQSVFRYALVRSTLTYLVGVIVFVSFYFIVGKDFFLFKRMIPFTEMVFLATGWFFQVLVNGMAVYIRAHKEEPLLIPSFSMAIYIVIVTIFAATYLPLNYFFIGFFTSYIWGLPWINKIFNLYYQKGYLSCK